MAVVVHVRLYVQSIADLSVGLVRCESWKLDRCYYSHLPKDVANMKIGGLGVLLVRHLESSMSGNGNCSSNTNGIYEEV